MPVRCQVLGLFGRHDEPARRQHQRCPHVGSPLECLIRPFNQDDALLASRVAEGVYRRGADAFHDGILIGKLHCLQRPGRDLRLVGKWEIRLTYCLEWIDCLAQRTVDHRGDLLARYGQSGGEPAGSCPLDHAKIVSLDDLGICRVGEGRGPGWRRLARQLLIQLHDNHAKLLAGDGLGECTHDGRVGQPIGVGEFEFRFCPRTLGPVQHKRVSSQHTEGGTQRHDQEHQDKRADDKLPDSGL